jgi:hypothetical protein
MNFLLTFALAVTLAAPAGPIATVEPDSGSVAFTTATVWLRSSPTVTSKKVTLLPRGAQVRVIWCRVKACNVEFQHFQGYVVRELLRAAPARGLLAPAGRYLNARAEVTERSALTPEDALALLQGEHQFSIPLLLLEDPATPTR